MVQRALSPATINRIEIDNDEKRTRVYLKPDQVSLAIGRGGLNIKLASKLVDYEIDVYRDVDEEEYDIDLEEFADEIESWVLDALKNVGYDTAKSVLAISNSDLAGRADLEIETVQDLKKILRAEFDDEEE